LFTLSDIKVQQLVDRKKKGATTLAQIKSNPQRLLITILIGNNLVNIGASAIATVTFTKLLGSSGVGIATGVMTFLVLVFGEIAPKSFATSNAEKVSLFMARPIAFLQWLLAPAIWILNIITSVFIKKGADGPAVTQEELRIMARVSAAEGSIRKKEHELLENIFKFNDITAEDVMTPRVEMFSLDGEQKLSEVLQIIINKPYSRIPVFKKNRDHIIGILYVRDVLERMANKKSITVKIKTLVKKPFFVTKEVQINNLFHDFQEKKVHIAIVLDEYGGTQGIVTLEDLLEELVGEIIDESDVGKRVIMRIDKNTILVDGATEVRDVVHFLNVEMPGKATATISELILKRIGKIPKQGEELRTKNALLVMHEVSEKQINRVRVIKKPTLAKKEVSVRKKTKKEN